MTIWPFILILAGGAGFSVGMVFTLRHSASRELGNTDFLVIYTDMKEQRDSLLISLELANATAKATAFANEKALSMMHEILLDTK